MLTLYHAPHSRATRIVQLIHALDAVDTVDFCPVGVRRNDGSGQADPANPHPEGKVPLLVDDGVEIWESAAIMLYLTDLYPESGLGVPVGDRLRGRYLSWLVWYGDIVEPQLLLKFAEIEHPVLWSGLRGMAEMEARIKAALAEGPWLVGGRYTAADMLIASAFLYLDTTHPDPVIAEWVARCAADPSLEWARARDAAAMAAA